MLSRCCRALSPRTRQRCGPYDSALDWFNALREQVRGGLAGAAALPEVNAALREVFSAMHLEVLPGGRVEILPVLRHDHAWKPAHGADVLARVQPMVTGRNAQEPDRIPLRVALLPLAA